MKSSELSGKMALVTGAGSGIGKAIALELGRHGAALCLVGRDKLKLEATSESLAPSGISTAIRPCDLGSLSELQALCDEFERISGRLDLLIHSAGLMRYAKIGDATLADFELQWRVNVMAPYALTQRLLPLLRKSRGQIVFINSPIAPDAGAARIQYAATKYALKAIADGVRAEVNPDGIRVLSVFPSRTATPLQEFVFKAEGRNYQPERLMQPEELATVVVNVLRLPRMTEITDLNVRSMIKP